MIKAGSTVKHGPTQEEWLLLGVNETKNKVCVAGWPPTMANLSDCVEVEEGTGITEHEKAYRDKEFGTDWD